MEIPGLNRLKEMGDKLSPQIGWTGERKALSLLCLGFYCTLFFLTTLQAGDGGIPEWMPVFGAMFALYTITFIAVASEWFWGRWFATGLGFWGLGLTGLIFVMTRQLPNQIIFFGVTHGLIAVCLMGERMAALFDAKPEWRQRWNLDEQAVVRVRKSVTRAASSLPALILYALSPRQPEEGEALGRMLGVGHVDPWLAVFLVVVVTSLVAFLAFRRTWGLLMLGLIAVTLLAVSFLPTAVSFVSPFSGMSLMANEIADVVPASGFIASALLFGAVGIWARPLLSYVRK